MYNSFKLILLQPYNIQTVAAVFDEILENISSTSLNAYTKHLVILELTTSFILFENMGYHLAVYFKQFSIILNLSLCFH